MAATPSRVWTAVQILRQGGVDTPEVVTSLGLWSSYEAALAYVQNREDFEWGVRVNASTRTEPLEMWTWQMNRGYVETVALTSIDVSFVETKLLEKPER